jgi:GTP-binding protein HflX
VRPGVDIPVSDTVGFVRDLPHHLVASFRSTLAEALHADLLLHVVDASHPEAESQVQAVKGVLAELGVDNDQVLGVLNKVDKVPDKGTLAVLRAEFAESVQVSALTGAGLDRLADRVVARRSGDWTELWLRVPHDQARLAALVHEHGEVILDRWTDDGWHAKVSVPKAVVWQLEGCVGVEDDPVLTAPEGEE